MSHSFNLHRLDIILLKITLFFQLNIFFRVSIKKHFGVSTDVKANVKQHIIKDLVAVSYKFL